MADSDADDVTSGNAPPEGAGAGGAAAAGADASGRERGADEAAAADADPAADPHEDAAAPAAGRPDASAAAGGGPADESAGGPEGPGDAGPASGVGAEGRPRRRRVGRWIAAGVAVALLLAAGGAFGLYEKLQGNIHREHVADQLGTNRPPKLNKSMNILLLGSDSRAGANHQYWSPDVSGERSDTTILLHLSPNRDRAVAVSFPRDSMVRVPECKKKNGQTVPAYFGMLNSAFAYAGATCTWKMIESTTHIHIDHYVKIDFAGFKKVVDALGGVEICVPQPVDDPRADLYLKAGRQVVKGDAALGYVRTRYGIGDGSDLERIQRQQKFMAAVVKKATSGDMLTDPTRTYRFLDAVTKAISTDDTFSVSAMRRLATSVKGMSAGTVRFVTVPTQTYPKDPNRVQWDMAQAGPLFDAIRNDDNLPAPPQVAAQPAQPKPDQVKVTTVNAPKSAVTALTAQGFRVTATKGPAAPQTRILYGAGAERDADALAVAIPGAIIAAGPAVPAGTVSLVVGPEGVQVRSPDIPKVHGEVTVAQDPCKSS